jgi:ABC-type lipoprotein release transport system permease subunit
MRLAFQLAYRNLMGAGLRTWLNVIVLSFAYVMIIFYNGILDGWNQQARTDTIAWEYGEGQLRFNEYDPYDPFTILDGNGILPEKKQEGLTPVLLRQGTIYPEGRMLSALVKGIDAEQTILNIPTTKLLESDAAIPVVIGKRMAESTNLKEGDEVLMRWRDKNGTYDASNITVVGIFDCNVPTADDGQIWMGIDKLWEITQLQESATYYIASEDAAVNAEGWTYMSQTNLLQDLTDMIEMKKYSSSIMYGLLLAIALLAIFDTQVLSIFRRQREIGTYISLGMTRSKVVTLFTFEGTMYSILATIVGSIYGIPIFWYMTTKGMSMPEASQNAGLALADTIYPVYSVGLILGTVLLVVVAATIVSFMPARKIAKMDPVDALKGKMQ